MRANFCKLAATRSTRKEAFTLLRSLRSLCQTPCFEMNSLCRFFPVAETLAVSLFYPSSLIHVRPQFLRRCSRPHPRSRGSGPLPVPDLVFQKEFLLRLSAIVIQQDPSSPHRRTVSFKKLHNLDTPNQDGRTFLGTYRGALSETAPYLARDSSHLQQKSREWKATTLNRRAHLGIMGGGPHSLEHVSNPFFAHCCVLLNCVQTSTSSSS
jgi:hypothetical protein